jgi:hypothetical protein
MSEHTKCMICFDKLEEQDIFCLPCGHYSHFHCSKLWCQKKLCCPVCGVPWFVTSHKHLESFYRFENQRHNEGEYDHEKIVMEFSSRPVD